VWDPSSSGETIDDGSSAETTGLTGGSKPVARVDDRGDRLALMPPGYSMTETSAATPSTTGYPQAVTVVRRLPLAERYCNG
jgi:hypothetical protein